LDGNLIDWLSVLITGGIAFHALTYRDARGESPWVHLLFGCIALIFCLRFLFGDILDLF